MATALLFQSIASTCENNRAMKFAGNPFSTSGMRKKTFDYWIGDFHDKGVDYSYANKGSELIASFKSIYKKECRRRVNGLKVNGLFASLT